MSTAATNGRLTIGQFMDANQLTPLTLSEALTRAGRPTAVATTSRRTRAFPRAWAKALGVSLDDLAHDASPQEAPPVGLFDPPPDPTEEERDEGRRSERPPEPPAGAKIAPPAPTSAMLRGHARKRIAGIYDFAGTSLGMALDPQGANADSGVGGGIVKAWSDHSGPIADAWIAAAEEGNVWAQKFVALMATGGTAGELVILHLGLAGATLYVAGQLPEIGPVYGKYRKYRPAPKPAPERARADNHGAGASRAGDSVASAPVTA